MEHLTIEKFKKDSYKCWCKEQRAYAEFFDKIAAVWETDCWVFGKAHLTDVQEFAQTARLDELAKNVKSRKSQTKYKRECSDNEGETAKPIKPCKAGPRIDEQFYKELKAKPALFIKPTQDDESVSSSSASSCSTNSYPTPRTPRRRRAERIIEDYDELRAELHKLQKKVCRVEIENKKLKLKLA